MFCVQWENPVCDETISPACVAIVPGFPGCLEVTNNDDDDCFGGDDGNVDGSHKVAP